MNYYCFVHVLCVENLVSSILFGIKLLKVSMFQYTSFFCS